MECFIFINDKLFSSFIRVDSNSTELFNILFPTQQVFNDFLFLFGHYSAFEKYMFVFTFMRVPARTSRSGTHFGSLGVACDQSATVLANSQS